MAPGASIAIRIDSKRFGQSPLFSGFRLDVTPGSIVALTGPSGVGKSSLVRLIAGIDCDFTGTILVDNVPPCRAPATGFVFQDARLLPWYSAIDNILAVAPRIGAERGLALLDRVGLRGAERAYPHQLSGGMQRRVAIARALAVNPRLLLLDEPFVSLDAPLGAELRRVVLDIVRADGVTAIIVTHLPDDVRALADRVVAIDGRPAVIVSDVSSDRQRRLPPRN